MPGSLGIATSMLRSWRDAGDRGHAGSPRRSHTQAASACRCGFGGRKCRLRRERAPAHGAGDFKKNAAHLLGSAEMKFRLIEDQRERFPVRVVCDVMGVSPVGVLCLAWPARKPAMANCGLPTEIRRLSYDTSGTIWRAQDSTRPCAPMGRRRAVAASNATIVYGIGTNATAVSGAHYGQPSLADRSRTRLHGEIRRRAAQSGLARRHHLRANRGRVARSGRRARSLHPQIVGWAMRDHMRAELTIAALTMAIQRQKPPSGLTHHSDRGRQYAAAGYRKVHDAAGMIQSMSRKGNCWTMHRWKAASAL